MTPDELRKLDEELCAVLEGDHSGAQIAYLRGAIAGYADAWKKLEHAAREVIVVLDDAHKVEGGRYVWGDTFLVAAALLRAALAGEEKP
jgi:hypothetical protein